jgi:hypothetical protein
MPESQSVSLIDDPEQAIAATDPIRRRILALMREPMSATTAAATLRLPRQRVAYYVNDLRKQRLLRVVGTRRKGNFRERLLQTTARAFVIAPQALGELGADPAAVRDRFSSAYLTASAAQVLRDMTVLERGARAAKKSLATMTLQSEVRFASSEAQHEFAESLTRAFASLAAKYHDDRAERGRRFRFLIAGDPAPAPDTTTSETTR